MTEQQLEDLLAQMTLHEKLCQLTQGEPRKIVDKMAGVVNPDANKNNLTEEEYYALGSVISYVPKASVLRGVQQDHMAKDRNKIPLLFMSDVVHGKETVFPIPLAMGCSFNPELVRSACETAAREASASGVHTVFAPACDLARDPRWGRVMESYGEDPYLNAQMAAASVRGFQGGEDRIDEAHVSSCMKHYLGYGACFGGRDYNTSDVSEYELQNYYMRSFEGAAKAGVAMAMTSFNTLDGIPMTIHEKYLRTLREELGFGENVIISDYNSLAECENHGITGKDSELAHLALTAGLDIEMMSTKILSGTENLVRSGELSEEAVDKAVMRILRLKNRLGLFENPYRGLDETAEKNFARNPVQREKARNCALECGVLLKNEGVLPISVHEKIGLAGPFADSDEVGGEWAFAMLEPYNISLYQGLCSQMPKENITLACCDRIKRFKFNKEQIDTDIPEYGDVSTFADCDKILVAIGEHMGDSGEAASKHTISLTPNQIALVRKLRSLGKPVIAVVFAGRPMDILQISQLCDGVLYAWYLGCETGNALAELLLGRANPSGKLAMSLPANLGQIPVHYNHLPQGRQWMDYIDYTEKPLYPFGYGLSYSKFEYSNLTVDGRTVTVTVKNVSSLPGAEVVQLYIRDHFAKVSRPVKELKAFQKLWFAPGEEKTVTFTVTDKMLSYWYRGQWLWEPGTFSVFVGPDSERTLSQQCEY